MPEGEGRTADETLALELVERARSEGVDLVGPGGLLTDLTKTVLETALEAELEDHLGYPKHAVEGRDKGNSRNGVRSKTVLTEIGEVEIDVPRDRDGSFEPKIVAKRQRRLAGVDELVISLAAKGLTTGEIAAHLADVYGAEVSRDTISRITDAVVEELAAWQSRPLDAVYPVVFIDAIHVKIRDGKVANRPVYTVVGVTVNGERDILGLWVGDGSEGAKYWHQVLSEILNRGTVDVLIVICDGLRGLPDAIGDVWPLAIVQTCVLHLIRNTFRYASKADWAELARDLRPIYSAPTEQAAHERLDELAGKWGERYPAVVKLWQNAWAEFVPFLAYSPEIRKVIYSTNAIESLHARFRRSVRARGHFPNEQAAVKCLYLTVRSLDPTGRGRARWVTRWKAALNAFAITFEDRIDLNN
ncbi:MAG TPA: IS256 family transposase [Solirubrobacteraceae bacterium]|nr:IS256 family transposase [Solirubrobacteraceae bacterium]